jgi:hypothetical protein
LVRVFLAMAFLFGSPEDVAQTYVDNALTIKGPKISENHYDEMTVEELYTAMTYLYIAFNNARHDAANKEVLAILEKQYTEIVLHTADVSDRFKGKILNREIQFPGGPEERNRYKRLVLERSAN